MKYNYVLGDVYDLHCVFEYGAVKYCHESFTQSHSSHQELNLRQGVTPA